MAPPKFLLLHLALIFLLLLPLYSNAQLSESYYSSTCSSLLDIVKFNVRFALNRDKRMGASLVRLFFHDCFVQGCDASVLLDDNLPSIDSEKKAIPNINSLRGFELVDKIKDAVDKACPGPIVSCADILAIAARDSIVKLGGPSWVVPLGRKDARTANRNEAENLPSPFSDLQDLIKDFNGKGFTAREMVALSGAHSIGMARCSLFRSHLYNGTSNIDASVASERKSKCPLQGGDDNLSSLDLQSPNRFGNNYFQSLVRRRGLLHSDQVLFNGGSVDDIVRTYSNEIDTFYRDFANAMVKMGNMSPLTGNGGEVRKNCRRVN